MSLGYWSRVPAFDCILCCNIKPFSPRPGRLAWGKNNWLGSWAQALLYFCTWWNLHSTGTTHYYLRVRASVCVNNYIHIMYVNAYVPTNLRLRKKNFNENNNEIVSKQSSQMNKGCDMLCSLGSLYSPLNIISLLSLISGVMMVNENHAKHTHTQTLFFFPAKK